MMNGAVVGVVFGDEEGEMVMVDYIRNSGDGGW